MVLKNTPVQSEKRYQFIYNKDRQIETRYISRSVKATMDSKRDLVGLESLPFGYEV